MPGQVVDPNLAMRIQHEHGASPCRMLDQRAKELCLQLPASEISGLVISDDQPLRAISLASALRYHGTSVAIQQSTVKSLRPAQQKVLEASCIPVVERKANVVLCGDGGIIDLSPVKQRLVLLHASWQDANEAMSIAMAPSKNDARWRNGTFDAALYVTTIVLGALRVALGERIGLLFRERASLPSIGRMVARPFGRGILLEPHIKSWYRRLAIGEYDIASDKRLVEHLSIQAQEGRQGTDLQWDEIGPWLNMGSSPLRIIPSGSVAAAAKTVLAGDTTAFGIAPLPFGRETCDVIVCGRDAQIIQRKLRAEKVSSRVINCDQETIPRARIFVAADGEARTVDMALAALLAGVIPIVPAGIHSALWAVPSFVAYVCNSGGVDEIVQRAKGLAACNSKVLGNWSMRGQQVWHPLFCAPQ